MSFYKLRLLETLSVVPVDFAFMLQSALNVPALNNDNVIPAKNSNIAAFSLESGNLTMKMVNVET